MSVRARLAAFLALDGAQRRLLILALVLLPLYALALRWLGLRRVQTSFPQWPRAIDGAPPCAAEIARLVSAAARHGPYRATCLATSLMLQRLLRSYGIESELRLGVRKVGDELEAHAWLEQDGAVLFDMRGARERFAVLEPAMATSTAAPE